MTQVNPYKDVHKGIRKLLLDFMQQISQAEFDNEKELDRLRVRQIQVFDLLELHSEIEDTLLAPLIAGCVDAKLLANIDTAHQQLEKEMKALTNSLENISAGVDNTGLGQAYCLEFSAFVAAQLEHMYVEETQVWPQLSRSCDDAQMLQIQAKARQMLPPVVMQTLLKAMIPAMSHRERHLMLSNMQSALPEPAFARISSLAEETLPEKDWLALHRELGLQADG